LGKNKNNEFYNENEISNYSKSCKQLARELNSTGKTAKINPHVKQRTNIKLTKIFQVFKNSGFLLNEKFVAVHR